MSDVWGGGLVVVAAAALWLVYLIPTWLRRREYLATERNAVRLQQTLRILAETAEIPQEVRLEANARTVVEQQRMLRDAEARAAAVARARQEAAAAEDALAAAQATARAEALAQAARDAMPSSVRATIPAVSAAAAAAATRRRARRVRATTSLVLLFALLATGFGGYLGVSAGTWYLLAAAVILSAGCVATLVRLARPTTRAAAAQAAAPPTPVSTELFDHAEHDDAQPEQAQRVSAPWTPQPLPKPLYLSRGTIAASAMASVDAAVALRRAAAAADLDRRAAELTRPVPQLRPEPVAVPAAAVPAAVAEAAPSRFARMGIVDPDTAGSMDLDAALRRRRTAS
jgi:hypothetical protein